MSAIRAIFVLGLLIGGWIGATCLPASAQTTCPQDAQPPEPGLRKVTGDDAKRAEKLDKAIERALTADRWDEAIARAEELLGLRTRIQGPTHFETVDAERRLKTLRTVAPMPRADRLVYLSAATINGQAEALSAQGKYAEAQPMAEKALEMRRRLLTDDNPETARSYHNLGLCLSKQGKYAQAQAMAEKAHEIRRRLLTDDHPDTAQSCNSVAVNLNAQGKYVLAQPMFERALAIRRRVLTDDHAETARSYNNTATNLNDQGKHVQAQPLHEKALAIWRSLLTDDHADTALGYNNLGVNLGFQAKYALAQPLFEKALAIRRRLLTDDHLDTANSYNNLALDLASQRKYAQAQPLFEKALEIKRRLLTDNDRNAARSYNNVANNLKNLGKNAQAQPLYEKALEIHRRLLTDDHPHTAISYGNLASNLNSQGKCAQAQPLAETALEIHRRLLTDDHPETAQSYTNVANILKAQGQYAQAQRFYEKALEIRHRLLTDDHPFTANSYGNLAEDLMAQGKYLEARDLWLSAVKSLDAARVRVAFSGLERAVTAESVRHALAAVLARLGQPTEAWQRFEEGLGRGLLDELAARQDRRLALAERARLRELTAELERLDKLVETTPKGLDQAERAKRFEDLKRQRELASIALGEFQTKLVDEHGPLAGEVARPNEIQAALPADGALVAWIDIPPAGPNAADPDGEHWGVVVRSRGIPAWIAIAGTGRDRQWTKADSELAGRVRTELRRLPAVSPAELGPLVEKLGTQRLVPLAKALGATLDGLPPARKLVVLPSNAMAGIPIECSWPETTPGL